MDNYHLHGTVIKGAGWATQTGYPTANLDPQYYHDHPVPYGLYACHVSIGDRPQVYEGITIIGVPPKAGEPTPKIEIYILDFKENILGSTINADVIEKIRDVRTYVDTDTLIKQIKKDIEYAREIFFRLRDTR